MKDAIGPSKETEYDWIIILINRKSEGKNGSNWAYCDSWYYLCWMLKNYFSKFWIVMGQKLQRLPRWRVTEVLWWFSHTITMTVEAWVGSRASLCIHGNKKMLCSTPAPSEKIPHIGLTAMSLIPKLITMSFSSFWVKNLFIKSGYLTRNNRSSSLYHWKASCMLMSSRISRRESDWNRLAEMDKAFNSLVALSISSSPPCCTSVFKYEKHSVGFTAGSVTYGQNPQLKSIDTSSSYHVKIAKWFSI